MFSTIPLFNAFCKVRNEFRLNGTLASLNVKKKLINITKISNYSAKTHSPGEDNVV